MDWGTKRKLIYSGAIALVVLGAILYIVLPYFTKPPTCVDKKQNGDETGVDCGGSMCANFCQNEVNPLVVLWSRSFNIAYDIYSSVAYIENQNPNAGIYQISYQFKLYDGNNILITDRTGTTFVAPNGKTAIFETGIKTGNRIPKRTAFSFTTPEYFIKVDDRANNLAVFSKEPTIEEEATLPKVRATVSNSSLYAVPGLDVIAILYDEFGNALGVSQTRLDSLNPNAELPVFFSWPQTFTSPIRKIEVIPRVNPFSVKLQ